MKTSEAILPIWQVFCYKSESYTYGGCNSCYSSINRITCPICGGSAIESVRTNLTTDQVSHYYNHRNEETVYN